MRHPQEAATKKKKCDSESETKEKKKMQIRMNKKCGYTHRMMKQVDDPTETNVNLKGGEFLVHNPITVHHVSSHPPSHMSRTPF